MADLKYLPTVTITIWRGKIRPTQEGWLALTEGMGHEVLTVLGEADDHLAAKRIVEDGVGGRLGWSRVKGGWQATVRP